MKSKKFIVYSLVMLIIMVSVGVSYSYFVSSSEDNSTKVKVSSKEISIVFTDTVELSDSDIRPGWSTSKSFSVENKSNDVFNYNIVIKNLINTFVTEGFLQYKITSDTGYSMSEYVDVPKSSERKDVNLAYDIDIEKGSKHEYTIEFIYRDSEEVDQSVDMGKEFGGTLAIVEGSIDPNKFYSVTLNMENAQVNGDNPKETIKNGSVSFDYTLNEGYNLGSLSCDGEASIEAIDGKIVVSNVKTNQICTANTSKKTYTWEMKITNGKTDALNRIVEYGGEAIFNITPNTGYTLEGAVLSEGCFLEGNTVKVSNVRSNGVCEVTLAKAKYSVSLGGENVTVSNSPKEVEYEGSTTFTVSPKTGYNLNNATVNCDNGARASLNGSVVSVSNIKANTTCVITPILNTYELTLTVVNGGGGSKKTVSHGGSTTYTLTANTGYNFLNPTINCTGGAAVSLNGSTLTISGVTTSQTCTVTLKKNTYTVGVGTNSTSYGTVSPGSQVIEHGNSAVVTISPKTGYHYVSNNCGGTVSGNTMTIPNIISNKSCTVTFGINTYTVYASVSNGSATPTSRVVNYNGSTTFTITPSSGYTLTGASVSGTGCSLSDSTLTASGVISDITCTVTLKKSPPTSIYVTLNPGTTGLSGFLYNYTCRSKTDYVRVGWAGSGDGISYSCTDGGSRYIPLYQGSGDIYFYCQDLSWNVEEVTCRFN